MPGFHDLGALEKATSAHWSPSHVSPDNRLDGTGGFGHLLDLNWRLSAFGKLGRANLSSPRCPRFSSLGYDRERFGRNRGPGVDQVPSKHFRLESNPTNRCSLSIDTLRGLVHIRGVQVAFSI